MQASGVTKTERFALIGKAEIAQSLLDEAARALNLSRESVQDIYPSTPLQESLVAATMQSPQAYVGQFFYRLSSDIEMSRLRAAWENVVEAHDILRTRFFHSKSHGMLQVVVKESIDWEQAESLN
jgi:hypothetical protein